MVIVSCTDDVTVAQPIELDCKAWDEVAVLRSDEDEAVNNLLEEVAPERGREVEGATKEEEGCILVEIDGSAHAEGLLLQRLAS